MNKKRVIELFAGYGSQHLALKRLQRDHPDFQYEVVAFCEIDRHAIKAYRALHGTHIPNLGDITQVNPDDVPDCDLMTWSFPCTDISTAGQMKGLSENSQTRSSLCWEAVRLFRTKRPKYLLMENVKNLVSEKFQADFNALQLALQKIGYTNFWQVMNAKDYGVPQNRERVFMVSVLDCRQAFYFPKPFPLARHLKDVLEQNVEERYYLKEEQVEKLVMNIDKKESKEPSVQILGDLQPDSQWQGSVRQQNQVVGIEGIAPACTAEHYKHPYKIAEPQDNIMLGWTRSNTGKGDPTYHPVSVANCVTAAKRDNTQNYVIEPTIAAMRGRDKDNPNDRGKSSDNYAQRLELKQDGTSNTLTSVAKDNLLIEPTIIEDFYGTVREPRVYTGEAPTLRADRTGLMTIEKASVAKDNLLIEPKNINNEQTRVFTDINEANTREALRLLWQEVGTQTFCEKMGRLGRFQETQVLQQGVHEEGFCENGHDNTEQRHGSQLGETHSVDRGEQGKSVCGVREEGWQTGCASQGRKLEEQFLGEFNDCLSQLPHETPQAEECMRYLRQADGRWTWLLQQTLSTLEEIRQSTDGERKNCQGIRIRRLSERELYRLMDVDEPDIDTLLAAPIPRTQHTKLAGNSIAVACLYHIFRNLFVDTEPAAGTQTMLF